MISKPLVIICFLAASAGYSTGETKGAKMELIKKENAQLPSTQDDVLIWEGSVKDESVKLSVRSGKFDGKSKIDKDYFVDGYPCVGDIVPNEKKPHIIMAELIWNGKTINLDQKPFRAAFEPHLKIDNNSNALSSTIPTDKVRVYPSEAGDSIIVTIPCGGDITAVAAFTITKEGKVYRSTVAAQGG